MTDARTLLARHTPRLVYDSLEAYFADAASEWTDSPTNVLRRADGTVIAKPPLLSLGFLGPHTYANGKPVLASDVIGDTTRSYAANARAMHKLAAYANRIHARAKTDASGRLWLQYWCFYYYNDFQLAGPLLSGGKHEGDWEMVQIRLNASEQPEQAVYTQHAGAESRAWKDVKKSGDTPYVYVARGSHANYFAPGSHWTGTWWDQADGKGPQIAPALTILGDASPPWALWPGWWGDTKATASPLDANSPRGPAGHSQWSDPARLGTTAARAVAPAPAQAPPVAPAITASRRAGRLVVAYAAPTTPAALVVGLRPEGSQAPATPHAVAVDSATGEVELQVDGRAYEVTATTAAPGGVISPAVRTRVQDT